VNMEAKALATIFQNPEGTLWTHGMECFNPLLHLDG
jgi:hypothetical protein